MKAKKNPTLLTENGLGISEETARDVQSWISVAQNTIDKALEQARIESYVMDLKLTGERLSNSEKEIYFNVMTRILFFELRNRAKRKFIIPIQNIYLVAENLYICEHQSCYFWQFVDNYGESNLADIRDYQGISKTLYAELHKKKFDSSDTMRNEQQKRGLMLYYHPESVEANNGDIDFTEEDLNKLENIKNESKIE